MNTNKVFGFIAVIAAIGLAMAACDNTLTTLETAAKPAASPAGGAVASGATVTLSTATAGADIWYTTGGSAPAKNGSGSAMYTAPIEITAAVTIKAIAVKDGMNDSEVLEAAYTIEGTAPQTFEISNFTDTSGSATVPGTLRYALANAQDGDIIRFTGVTAGTSAVSLTSALPNITGSISIEGNGVTITRDASWTATDLYSQLLRVVSGAVVTVSRVHFKDGRATDYGAAIRNDGNLTLESCIFSGNQTSSPDAWGGAVYNSGTMSVKGCTFYNNSSGYRGGAIYNHFGTLTLEGNIFYGNTASRGPVVYNSSGTVTSLGYNVVDAALVTGDTQSGFAAATGDKTVSVMPIAPLSFKLLSGSGAAGVIASLPAAYPAVDFYGNPITAPAAAGAAQATVSGTGYALAVSVNNSARGSVSVAPSPDADGLISGAVSITATANSGCEFAYWLVDGANAGSANPYNFNISAHTTVLAVFTRTVTVNNFTDGSATTAGTLRYALANAQNGDIIRFTGVTAGTTVSLTSALPNITGSISIEGNGVTITRDASWTAGSSSQLLRVVSFAVVTVSRVHFKDGRATDYGAAIYNSGGNVSLASCIFSGNQTSGSSAYGGAVFNSNSGTMSVKGCTFYNNSGYYGGAIDSLGTLTLEGNIFYGNTASRGPVVYRGNGTVTSLGYNVVDAALGTGTAQSGFAAATGDKTISVMPVAPLSFKLLSGSGAAGVITGLPAAYPAVDFYGNPITAPAAAGAAQATVSGTGYALAVSVNNSAMGSVSVAPSPDADGLISGAVSITATANGVYEFAYWLVNGGKSGSAGPLSLNVTAHTTVQAVFTRTVTVNNFTDGSATTAGTLRYALANAQDGDTIRFTGVTAGTTVSLTSALPNITRSISIEGNGITITRDASWTAGSSSQLLRVVSFAVVTVSRVHFKDGRATDYGAAIRNDGNLTLESCIFSGSQTSNSYAYGGAVYNSGTMSVKGTTFYNNSGYWGGAIFNSSGTLTLEGNIFYGNTAASGYSVVYSSSGTVTSLGYNVVDAALGTGTSGSGWTEGTGDLSDTTNQLVDPGTFEPHTSINAIIPSAPANFPATDFYGYTRTFPGAPGAVK